jgi:hypothetical protein
MHDSVGPQVARPGYVSLIPGGPQVFPNDPVNEKELERRESARRFLENTPLHRRRRPKEEKT